MINAKNYEKTVLDQLSSSLAPVFRKLTDVNSRLFGTHSALLRITQKVHSRRTNSLQNTSVLGDRYADLEAMVVHSCMINYPFNDLEVFAQKLQGTDISTADVNVHGIDITDIIPIVATLQFEGEYDEDPIAIAKGDKLVDVFFDHNYNGIPIVMEVARLRGSFFGKNEITKKCELNVWRGPFSTEITLAIQDFITFLKDEEATEREKLIPPLI